MLLVQYVRIEFTVLPLSIIGMHGHVAWLRGWTCSGLLLLRMLLLLHGLSWTIVDIVVDCGGSLTVTVPYLHPEFRLAFANDIPSSFANTADQSRMKPLFASPTMRQVLKAGIGCSSTQ